MPTLLFHSPADSAGWWRDVIAEAMPELGFRAWPQTGDPADIDYALVWKPGPGLLGGLPNLRAILSLGAGVDHIFADPHLPAGVPICRVVDDNLTLRMREWVLLQVLMHHRQQRAYDAQQRNRIWEARPQPHAGERRVGVMGLGVIGGDSARHLCNVGFDVAGWSRTQHRIAGIRCFHGAEGLHAFLARTEILVCLLPLTPETTGILNADAFARMPRGASIINAGRGGQVVEADLLAALDGGQIAEATLDVFATEPLPQDSLLWTHPGVTVTPHVAAATDPRSVVHQVIENIRRIESGLVPLNTVDPVRGY